MPFQLINTPGPQSFDLPLIGDDLTKIGRIIDLYGQPCQPTAEIWVYAAFQAFPTLFITLTKPELWDINIRHRRGKPRKGRKYRFRPDAIFRDAIVEIPVPRWVVFRIYEWGQRIGWYFLVADALEDFGINWMSMAYQYNGCQLPDLIYADHENVDVLEGSSLTPTSRRLTWTVSGVSNMIATGTEITPTQPGFYRIGWNCLFKPHPIPEQSQIPITTQAVIDSQIVGIGEMGDAGGGNRSSSGSILIVADTPPFPSVQIHGQWLDPIKFCFMSGQWNAQKVGGNELGPDP